MLILMILAFLIIFPSMLCLCIKTKYKNLPFIGFIGIIIAFMIIGIPPTIQMNDIIGDSQKICTVGTTGDFDKSIYYDQSCNKYFIINTNKWNLFSMHYIEYLDTEIAHEIIKVAEVVNKWKD